MYYEQYHIYIHYNRLIITIIIISNSRSIPPAAVTGDARGVPTAMLSTETPPTYYL